MASVRQTMRNVRSSNDNNKNPSIKTLVRQMLKSHDNSTRELKRGVTYTAGTSAVAGVVFPLTQFIVQGNDVAQRDGSEIIVQRMTMRMQLIQASAADVVRVIVFRDMDCQGSLPAVTQVLDTADPISGFQLLYAQAHRFKIIKDESFATNINGDSISIIKKYDLKQNAKVHFYAATDISGANGDGSYFVLLISQVAASTAYSFGTEFMYYD